MTRVAIVQSNYIPWKGYFDLIASVDVFVIYDDMQYTKRDWRNRNRIKTEKGSAWLTVPVEVKGKYFQKINEVKISDPDWANKHWNMLHQNYREAPCYDQVKSWLQPLYMGLDAIHLSEVNKFLIQNICHHLGIKTEILDSSDFELLDERNARLAHICQQVGGDEYVSGPAAQGYMDEAVFSERGIRVSWADYQGYEEYSQLWGKFDHFVTILDLMFNVGIDAENYMKFKK